MKIRVHHPLFAGFLAVVGLLVVLLVLLAGTGLRRELESLYRARIAGELALGAELLANAAGADPDSLVSVMATRVGSRVTLVDSTGRVLGDSDVPREDLADVESHRNRPEVRGALDGTVTFARRESATVGRPFLYGAAPARLGEAPVILRIAASLTAVETTVTRTQRAVALSGLAAAAVALAVAYVLSRTITRPLRSLAERAGLLAAGDFSLRAPRTSAVAELDELGQAFNRLADELEARLAELSRERDEIQALIDCMAEGVVALTDDARVLRTNRAARELLQISEPLPFAPAGSVVRQPELRDLLEEAVVRPVQTREVVLGRRHVVVSSRTLDEGGAVLTFLDISELRRMEQVRRDFVANASHELKTPLTAMRGFAETLLEDDPPANLEREFLESIHKNALRLQRLVDDLLDLSRLESGGWKARQEEVDVARTATEAWRDCLERADAGEVAFEVRGRATAWADERGLEQIFRNLFDNALRYTPGGGSVTVHVEAGERQVDVAVSDTGAGIPSRALPRIFERFYRVDAGRDRQEGGTGLGLSIVRHLVSAMGGKVTAESELGRGTTVRFTLPAAPPSGGA